MKSDSALAVQLDPDDNVVVTTVSFSLGSRFEDVPAIGAIPAAAGVAGGDIILAVAVLSILITAPLGAIGIEKTGKRLLKKEARHQGAGPSTK